MIRNRRSFLFRDVPTATAIVAWAGWGRAAEPRSGKVEQAPVDIARFGQVVTCDPMRIDGARAARTEEFHANDLFLESEVPPSADGTYIVPVTENGMGCIGLRWVERRPLNTLELQFADSPHMPSVQGVRVQAWVGNGTELWGERSIVETLWQGHWAALPGKIDARIDTWRFNVDLNPLSESRGAVHKVRWLFPPSAQPIVLRRLSAYSGDQWDTAEMRIELAHTTPNKQAEIEIHNGEILEPAKSRRAKRLEWDLSTPLKLRVLYLGKSLPPASTRTLLRVHLSDRAVSVSVNDVLERDYVYLKPTGLLVASGTAKLSLAQYAQRIGARKTVLEHVREMPDQIFTRAMEKAHHTIQDSGPMLLSLACDNAKFVLEPDGTVLVESHGSTSIGLTPKFGTGIELKTQLHNGWLPVPVRTVRDSGVLYQQRTFVVPYDKGGPSLPLPWLNRRSLGVVEYTIENTSSRPADVSLALSVTSDWKYLVYGLAEKRSEWLNQKRPRIPLQRVQEGALAQSEGRPLVYIKTLEGSPLRTILENDVLGLKGTLPPGARARCWAYLPRWVISPEGFGELRGEESLLQEVESYWKSILESGTRIDLPDPELMRLIRALQVHGLISSRNEGDGERIEQWGASMTYRALNALYYIIPAMDMLGFPDFARRALEFYIPRYSQEGLLSDGYTLAGVGWHLELLWNHYLLTRDMDWLRKVAPQMERAAWWIVRQKEKTKRLDPQGNKLPEYGLAPPGVTADWHDYNYYFCLNGYFCGGLQATARALAEIGYEDSVTLQAHAKDYREEILRAYHWAQTRMPVNPLRNGTWVPPYPSQVPLPGTLGLFFPGEDNNRPALGCYDVELGAHNMIPLNVLEANSPDADWMLDHMEDYWFLTEGWHDYPAAESEKDWFNLGGFSKVQPNLCRVAEIYAARDDIKPFLRAYFNSIAPQINKQNLTFWEDFTPDSGAWGSMEGSGYTLLLTRLMLVMERGDDLWLAPLITNNWMKEGMSVSVVNAPTHFGPVSFRILSSAKSGFIEAEIEPPLRNPPQEIIIRLRHPEGIRMRAVSAGGMPHKDFDADKEIVRLKPAKAILRVKVEY